MSSTFLTGSRHRRGSHFADLLVACSLIALGLPDVAHTQAPPPITSSGLNTTVTKSGNAYDITGGTRPGSGPNLFHSFGEFGVPASHIANFLNDAALPTSNILGRVTGGNPSNIFGTLQTSGFGSANLFLMNPAGILFGPNASLNVGGSVSFTTADYLRLTDGARFNAVPGPLDAAISSAPVAAFGFLGSNPAAITLQAVNSRSRKDKAFHWWEGISPFRVGRLQLEQHNPRVSLRPMATSISSVSARQVKCWRTVQRGKPPNRQ